MKKLFAFFALAMLAAMSLLTGCGGGDTKSMTGIPDQSGQTTIQFDSKGEMIAPAGAVRSESYSVQTLPNFEEMVLAQKAGTRGGPGSENLPVTWSYDGTSNTWKLDQASEYLLYIDRVGMTRSATISRSITRGGPPQVEAEYAFRHVSGGQIVRSAPGSEHIVGYLQPGDWKGGAVFTIDGRKQYSLINLHVLSFEELSNTAVLQMYIKSYAAGNQYNNYTSSLYLLTQRDSNGMLIVDTQQTLVADVEMHSALEPQSRGAGDPPAPAYDRVETYAFDMDGNRTNAFVENGYWDYGRTWQLQRDGQYIVIVDVFNGDKLVGTFYEGVNALTGLGFSK